MEKSINVKIAETKQNVMNVLATSELPVGVCVMIMHELTLNVSAQNENAVKQETAAYEKAIAEESKGSEEKPKQ